MDSFLYSVTAPIPVSFAFDVVIVTVGLQFGLEARLNYKTAKPNSLRTRVRAKEIGGKYWQPKTGKNRVVPVSVALRSYLDTYAPAKNEGNWFFPSLGGNQWDPDNFSQFLRETNAKAGLVWGCLDYRHTFGSHLAMKGESLYKISELMGNSPEICRKHYAHLMPESLVDSVEFRGSEAAPPVVTAPLPLLAPDDTLSRGKLRLVVNNAMVDNGT